MEVKSNRFVKVWRWELEKILEPASEVVSQPVIDFWTCLFMKSHLTVTQAYFPNNQSRDAFESIISSPRRRITKARKKSTQ